MCVHYIIVLFQFTFCALVSQLLLSGGPHCFFPLIKTMLISLSSLSLNYYPSTLKFMSGVSIKCVHNTKYPFSQYSLAFFTLMYIS